MNAAGAARRLLYHSLLNVFTAFSKKPVEGSPVIAASTAWATLPVKSVQDFLCFGAHIYPLKGETGQDGATMLIPHQPSIGGCGSLGRLRIARLNGITTAIPLSLSGRGRYAPLGTFWTPKRLITGRLTCSPSRSTWKLEACR